MNFVNYQGFIICIAAIIYADGFKIQHNNRTDQRGGKNPFMQADIPTNRRQDTKLALTIKTTSIKNGEAFSITCKAEKECMVNSWSVKEQNGTYETVVRESTPFNRTKYGAQLSKVDGKTIYILIIYQLDRNDIHNDYRCDCDTSSEYITAMHDNSTMRNDTKKTQVIHDTKKTQDLSQNNAGFMSLAICGIVVLLVIAILLYTKTASKYRIINQERSDNSVDCSSNAIPSFQVTMLRLQKWNLYAK